MKRRLAGFTLLETLLASVLLGALLLALNFFVLSMAEIWGAGAERRLFGQHVRAVTREIETWLRTASLPPQPEQPMIFVSEVRLEDGRREHLLTFVLPAGNPRLPWRDTALPEVVGSLMAEEGRGLVLYWHSRLETAFDEGAPRAWVVTPYVTGLTFDYLESGSWRASERLERGGDGNWRTPARLRLQFRHAGQLVETSVLVPAGSSLLPYF